MLSDAGEILLFSFGALFTWSYASPAAAHIKWSMSIGHHHIVWISSDTSNFAGARVIGPAAAQDKHKKCLVLDLDETLVHSSFKPVPNPDFIIPVEIEDKIVEVYVLKRPFMDQFMADVGSRFEVVVFTASLSKYADPLLDLLDIGHVVRWRLCRGLRRILKLCPLAVDCCRMLTCLCYRACTCKSAACCPAVWLRCAGLFVRSMACHSKHVL